MASVNKVILIGNAGKDPEVKYMPSGKAVANLRIATTSSWKDKTSGERKEETEWHSLVFYDRLAEVVGEYVKKGSSIYVEGRLKTRRWQDKEGVERHTTEIQADQMTMLGGKQAEDKPAPRQQRQSAPEMADDDVPFAPAYRGRISHSV